MLHSNLRTVSACSRSLKYGARDRSRLLGLVKLQNNLSITCRRNIPQRQERDVYKERFRYL